MMVLHQRTHPTLDVPGCFGCRCAHVAVAPSATPSRRGGDRAAELNAKERQWSTDHAAYRRLVSNGLQPKTLDGAADLERRASTSVEIEHGLGAPKELGEINVT